MKSLNVSKQSKASRRALLLGLTLAEIMLVILFSLLLLLGATASQQNQESKFGQIVMEESLATLGVDSDIEEAEESLRNLLRELYRNKRSDESISDTWQRVSESIIASNNDADSGVETSYQDLVDDVNRLEKDNEQLIAEFEQAADKLSEANNYIEALVGQLDSTRGGATPPCLYRSPEPGSGLIRGVSVPVGLVKILDQQLIYEQIYLESLDVNLVDFWGRQVDVSDVRSHLEKLPIGSALSIAQFRELTSPLKNIGDVESDLHGRCMFTADYSMEDYIPLNMFTQIFQAYFLPQQRR